MYALVGTYYLVGMPEVGSQLRLKASGRFDRALSYGAVDQAASGVWRVQGNEITLESDKSPPPQLRFGERNTELLPYLRLCAKPRCLSPAKPHHEHWPVRQPSPTAKGNSKCLPILRPHCPQRRSAVFGGPRCVCYWRSPLEAAARRDRAAASALQASITWMSI